jgi:hypothetical protein
MASDDRDVRGLIEACSASARGYTRFDVDDLLDAVLAALDIGDPATVRAIASALGVKGVGDEEA